MNYKQFVPAILAILGITAFSKNDKGVVALTDEQTATLKENGFGDQFLQGFNTALAADFADGTPPAASGGMDLSETAQMTAQLANAFATEQNLREQLQASEQARTAGEQTINDLNAKVKKLSDEAEDDKGAGAQHGKQNTMTFNMDDEKQLGGLQGERFSLSRPYNQRARAAMLAREGKTIVFAAQQSIDYQQLKDDLGDFYRIPWQQRIESFTHALKSIESIFPLQSGYQDRAVLINLFLGEFSQADNTSSDFDKVVKGNYEFQPEELRMFDVMFAHKFTDLKAMEKTWIGHLNNTGSSVYKPSFIEFLLAETAKVLHNEREMRRTNGVRANPVLNQPGSAMGASDGLYEFVRKKVNGWIDTNTGKTVYQIKPFILGEINESNIGEKVFQGTKKIPQVLIDSGMVALYMPTWMITMYHKYNETMYAGNVDYKADIMHVKEYPSVQIIPVPNAESRQRLIWTIKGNIQLFEDTPGEMYRFYIELQDWSIKVWSNWKESVWARMVGYRYEKKEEMDYTKQLIFCNELDLSPNYFVPADKDSATPSAARHTSIETVSNTNEITITDIANATVGLPVRLRCGSTNKGVKITKAGNFALITKDWTPAIHDVITLVKRADGKFIELKRETSASRALMFAANDTTPNLQGATEFVAGENTQATAITDLTNATADVVYTIFGNGSGANASTIANGGKFVLTAAMTLATDKFIKLIKSDADGKFYELERNA